jgi:ABC-2 type transport system permease protein
MVSFVVIPTSLGTLACLLVAYAMPEMRRRAMVIAGALGLVLFAWLLWQAYVAALQHTITPAWVREMLARLRFTEHYLFPSWWLSTGLLEAAHPAAVASTPPADALLFLCVLVSHALLLQLMVWGTARLVFRTSFSRLQGLLPTQQPARVVLGDRWLSVLLRGFSPLVRAIMIKDIRLFRRDPVLWAQFLIFLALLAFYVVSLQRFEEMATNFTPWLTVMGFMNVGVIALIYSTFATRFILPIISLEGRAFWVLGTAPIDREQVVRSKFLLSSVVSIPPCLAIIVASDCLLPIAQRFPLLVLVHAVSIAMLCLGLSALAVGNGARFPNLRENSPSRIASGFGGTLNLVESGLFIIFFLFTTGVPGYLWVAAQDWNARQVTSPLSLGSSAALLIALALASSVAVVVAYAALRMGCRAFRTLQG